MEIRRVPIEEIWRVRQEVMYPGSPLEFVRLEDDNEGIHLGVYDNQELVSVISLFHRDNGLQFRKFATIVAKQNRGYGSRLLAYTLEWAGSKGINRVWCNARLSATALYEKFGMQPTGAPWTKYGLDFIKMEIIRA